MSTDPDRRICSDDPIRQRVADGEGIGWLPSILGLALLFGFGYLLYTNWNPAPDASIMRESNARIERPAVAPPVTPKAPN